MHHEYACSDERRHKGGVRARCGESEATETARQLSPELARALAGAGFFNMFVPNALGGQLNYRRLKP